MIGTRVRCTLWTVTVSYAVPSPEGPKDVVREMLVTTADPSGADLHDVARAVVNSTLRPGGPAGNFAMLGMKRHGDLGGLATCVDDAARQLEPGTMGAAVLAATESHRAELGELRRQLALAQARVRELENEAESWRSIGRMAAEVCGIPPLPPSEDNRG